MIRLKNFFILSLFLLDAIVLSGCSNKYYQLAKENISEIKQSIYYYNDDNIIAKFESGFREENYNIDGVHTNNIPFGLITFLTIDNLDNITNKTYEIKINNDVISGSFEQSPFDNSLVSDIGVLIDQKSKITLKVFLDKKEYECGLKCISNSWQVDALDALEIVCKKYKSKIKKFIKNNTFLAEIYVRAVNDKSLADSFFWYINITGVNREQLSVVIDVYSKEILVSKTD